MKKIILTTAIAAICAAPAAAMADTNLYGQMRYSFNSVDDVTGSGQDGFSGNDNVSLFGLKGSAGDNDLKAFYHLQTGAPALKPITPIDGGTVFGTGYIFRVEAEDEDPDGFDGITFVGFQVEGQTTWISLARDSTTSGIWFTYWDTTAFADGTYNITIVAQDNEGIAVKRFISITIANGGAAGAPPTVALTMPAKGSTNSGTV